jgi:ATP-dependent DNA helicase DinG
MEKVPLEVAFERIQGVLPGYELRQGQLTLARTIQRSFAEGMPALCEAPTGIGKSFAGLVPALLTGKRVVIATATIALQDQYLQADIPVLQRALGPFKAALVKGRRHYVSLRRLEQSLLAPPALRLWAQESAEGDWAELTDRPSPEIWDEIRSDSDDCLGKNCSHYQRCHYYASRRELEQADILVVNHALLLSDYITSGSILPPYDLLIVDEAHQFYDYATNAFTSETSNFGIRHLLRRVRKHFNGLRAYADQVEREAANVFLDIMTNYEQDRPFLHEYTNLIPLFHDMEKLRNALQAVATAGDMEKQMRQEKILQTLTSYCQHLDHLSNSEPNPGLINWVHLEGNKRGREQKIALLSTPLDIAPQLRQWFLDPHAPTAVFMSATLTTGGSDAFAYFRNQIGLKAGEATEQQLDSPFKYDQQCLLYLPKGLPQPGEGNFNQQAAQEIIRLLEISQGRAFILLTSNRAMLELYNLVSQHVPWPCRNQDQSSKRALFDWFLTTSNPVLFGVNSMWEGVSISGPQLSLVVIDRLPFQSPSDPVYEARCAQVNATGGRWFDTLALPHAALRLKQGFGRLIRTSQDRGIVTILDPRMTLKGYGKKLVKSLPPAKVLYEFDPTVLRQYVSSEKE